MDKETIFALASGAPPAAIAVMRLSGPETDRILKGLLGDLPEPRKAVLRTLRHPTTQDILDQGLVLRFRRGESYTGECSAELHLHGGDRVISAVEAALLGLGAMPATPGAFTRRALRAGRLDVAQAEAVASLIHAESDEARRQSLLVLDGAVGTLAASWRDALIAALALLETGVDFVDEALGDSLLRDAAEQFLALAGELREHVAASEAYDADQEPKTVVLIGPPNAGKSSLLNALTGRDTAIVTSIPGTTRDVVSAQLAVDGRSLAILDTAGHRETQDPIEALGVDRARQAAQSAWLKVYVASADTADAFDAVTVDPTSEDAVLFWTKADLDPTPPMMLQEQFGPRLHVVSARDDSARQALRRAVAQVAAQRPPAARSPIAGSTRRVALVRKAQALLEQAARSASEDRIELAALDARGAASQIEGLIGAVDHEDTLDAVFSRFCIGK